MSAVVEISEIKKNELEALGKIMVRVYSSLDNFPSPEEQPKYYNMLVNVGDQLEKPGVKIFAARQNEKLLGGVVYYADMQYYGSAGNAREMKDGAGFRLLAVSPDARGLGVGKKLTAACIAQARLENQTYVYIHSTKAMQVAWSMYEKLGFDRYEPLDFEQQGFPVYGFRLSL